jgi:CRP-like cAMP-binding protein
MKEGEVVISVESFYKKQPSYEFIQALEDCRLYYITHSELQHIYHHFPEFNFVGRVLTEKYYMLSEQRLVTLRLQRSQERYGYLLKHFPEILQRVPSKFIASYLSISEAHYSVIRGKK